jgi:putative component of membrane protein insertase Oxa1/YidC/SpoIIIJ protein YidD
MKPATILCMIMLWSSFSKAQSLNKLLISKDTVAVSQNSFAFLKGDAKDGTTSLKSLFHFYKHYISTQDGQSCGFSPSCSEFAFLSIKKHGLVIGVIDFFDRFARCNPLSHENYPYDADNKVYIDPVE